MIYLSLASATLIAAMAAPEKLNLSMNSRKKLKTYYTEIVQDLVSVRDGEKTLRTYSFIHWQKGDKRRTDIFNKPNGKATIPISKVGLGWPSSSDGVVYEPGNVTILFSMNDIAKYTNFTCYSVDMKEIGFRQGIITDYFQAASVFDYFDWQNAKIEQNSILFQGRTCEKYTAKIQNDMVIVSVILDPNFDFFPVHIETETRIKPYKKSISTRSVEKDPMSGICFSREFRHQFYFNNELFDDASYTVREIKINQPIDDQIFTLRAIDMPQGHTLEDRRPGKKPH